MSGVSFAVLVAATLSPHAPHLKYLKQLVAPTGPRVSKADIAAAEKARPAALAHFAELGPAAKPYLRAICDRLAVWPQIDRAAVLEAVERIDPELYAPLREVVFSKTFEQQEAALAALGKLGPAGAPAAGYLVGRMRSLAARNPSPEELGEFALLVKALEEVRGGDVEATRAGVRSLAAEVRSHQYFRMMSVAFLVNWANADHARRKEVVPVMLIGLGLSDGPFVASLLRKASAYGEHAAELLPAVKKLKLSEDSEVRAAATEAAATLERVEKR